MNALVGTKLGGVSPKPQTTRHRILGIITGPDFQLGLVDTPGALERKINQLQKNMDASTWASVSDSDVVVMVTGPTRPDDRDLLVIDRIKRMHRPKLLVINKVDTVSKHALLPVMEEFAGLCQFKEIIPVSARKALGLDVLLAQIIKYLPEGDPLYPPDVASDRDMRFLASEIIREKVFLRFRHEIPYATGVVIDEFREAKEPVFIRAVLFVERPSQKAILLGKKGGAIKKIGTEARQELEYLLGKRVFLELWVKVKPNWRKDTAFLRAEP